ncbi:HAD-superfamily hydrolase, subfamily IA, variant 3 [Trichinella spiralis]|uniref:pseudouridine 5'-phosphatase n=1 Tax=Trichinella spiralis TaxID=6334 RepID=E5S4A4_TRISP|nr:HAD-superfamily hydrolase, subfamily IA, variant 3 [Trichinella spiralis]KRY27446.1 Pseudouridine-5'-monophosphatase [Trichinella spiralis]
MTTFKKVSHVIFDMDGLLLNTEDYYTEAQDAYLRKFGKTFTWELKCRQMGRTQREGFQLVIDEYKLPVSLDEMLAEVNSHLEKLFPHCQLMPGAERLVNHLHNHRIPMALCTGSKEYFYRIKSQNHQQVFSKFHHCLFTSDDPEVKHGKPNPDCFLICNSRFAEPPLTEKVLVFEDAINGVEAALKAGMQVVMVPDRRMSTELRQRATLCIESLNQLLKSTAEANRKNSIQPVFNFSRRWLINYRCFSLIERVQNQYPHTPIVVLAFTFKLAAASLQEVNQSRMCAHKFVR